MMAQSVSLFLAIIFTVVQTVACSKFRSRNQTSSRGGPRSGPLPWWVLPIVAIAGFVVTFLVLYFIKKLFSGQRTIKIRNSLRNRPRSPWRTTNNSSLGDPESETESAGLPPEYEHPPSYIEVTKEFEPPPPPAYDVIFKGSPAAARSDQLAELPSVDTELGACFRPPLDDGAKETSGIAS